MVTCFLHVPKSAGTSLFRALEAAHPAGAVAPRRMDVTMFCGFDAFDRLGTEARAVVAVRDREIAELARYRAVSGHFALPALMRLAPPDRIGTVLREPRARLVSYYLYLRCTPGIRETWRPYDVFSAADGTIDAFLADPRVATATDNKACRMLLADDSRVRDGQFIGAGDLEPLAEAAWARLRGLGFAGVLEDGADTWRGLGELFGVPLSPGRANVTGEEGMRRGALPVPPPGPRALELLERRSAGDAVLYSRIASRGHGSATAARARADAALATQLERMRRFGG